MNSGISMPSPASSSLLFLFAVVLRFRRFFS